MGDFSSGLKTARKVYMGLDRSLGSGHEQTIESREALKMIVQRSVDEARAKKQQK
jgi:hypothetical protein